MIGLSPADRDGAALPPAAVTATLAAAGGLLRAVRRSPRRQEAWADGDSADLQLLHDREVAQGEHSPRRLEFVNDSVHRAMLEVLDQR